MKYFLSLLLLLYFLQVSGQGNSKCFVVMIPVWDTTQKNTTKYIERNRIGKPLIEIEYGKNDPVSGQIIFDTSYYRDKRFYTYRNDTLLTKIIDCRAVNKQRTYADYRNDGHRIQYDIPSIKTTDTVITLFGYDNKGRLSKKENRLGKQLYYYENSSRIIRDTTIGGEFENQELEIDTSFAFYDYFDSGYCVLRNTNDSLTRACDSFIYNKNGQLIRHVFSAKIHAIYTGVESGKPSYTLKEKESAECFFYSSNGQITKCTHYYFGEQVEKEEYIYIY